MNILTKKDEKWWWGKEQQKAFDKLKQVFTTKPVLAVPDLDKEFMSRTEFRRNGSMG